VPSERCLPLPGYPGATPGIGNHAGTQFQLDTLGEALVLLAAADRVDRLDSTSLRALETLVHLIQDHGNLPEAGIWELDDRRWAHSRLMCAAGLRAVAQRRRDTSSRSRCRASEWEDLADRLVSEVDADCLHPSGRWQRSPDDPSVDAALLLPGIRGAVPAHDARNRLTVAAVRDDLSDDGYVYRFCQDPHSTLHGAEGAFVLSGFHMALAQLGLGRKAEALRWFERNRAVLGPPGLFAEEFDVVQRQLRGNLPQAFVHAAALETAQRLGDAHVSSQGFAADDR
jgi:alpha,alpha-trehalase